MQVPSAYEPGQGRRAPLRDGSFVALLDSLSASGIFHPCPERGQALSGPLPKKLRDATDTVIYADRSKLI